MSNSNKSTQVLCSNVSVHVFLCYFQINRRNFSNFLSFYIIGKWSVTFPLILYDFLILENCTDYVINQTHKMLMSSP